jgi:hypothetical protein
MAAKIELESGEVIRGEVTDVRISEQDTTVFVAETETHASRTIPWDSIRTIDAWRTGIRPGLIIAVAVVWGLLIYSITRPTKKVFPVS